MKKLISLNMTTGDLTQAGEIHKMMSQVALDFAHVAEAATVSMYDHYDDVPEYDGDYHDDQTLFRVMKALQQAGQEQGRTISAEDAQDIIRVLLNCGILFRERRPEPKNVTLEESVKDDTKLKEWLLQEWVAGRIVLAVDQPLPEGCGGAWCKGCSVHLTATPQIEKTDYTYKIPAELKNPPPMYNA